MDFRDPKNQKLAIVVIVIILIAYIWYDKMYTPTNVEIAEKYSQYEALLTKLNQVEQKAKNLENLKAEYNDLLQSYRPMETLLPENLEFSTLLSQVHASAQGSGSVVYELQPAGIVPQEFYQAQEYTVKMASTFHDLGTFFASVSNFPFIVNISKLIIQQYEDLPKTPKFKDKTLIADFRLTSYTAKSAGGAQKTEAQKAGGN
ncbi:MAG: type 4a pilus biogenesis protein PilO [candidate division Zixibacteria bacterium]|nr:type 4a pilus biogenesis protein PilO [candidate division Zixibacteria bacterium]